MMNNFTSVIAAVSTPPGKGGVAIIRISGDGALLVADKVFKPKSNKPFKDTAPRVQVRGDIYYSGEVVDDGMATYFKAPASYTGEDTVEIACHGGVLVTSVVLEAVFAAGAVPADAGEFTKRAFVNGKISLVEAEAIGNLLEAESKAQIKLSSSKSRTALSEKIDAIRNSLTSVLSSIYARIDYPDEDLGDFTDGEVLDILGKVRENIGTLLSTYSTGRAVSEGIKTVICGKPNVGKSTLYNLIVGYDAAIVTDIEGTTRDVLTEKIPLGSVMLKLYDTAGVRDSEMADAIEKIGIEKSLDKISDAELVLSVFDASRELDSDDMKIIEATQNSSAYSIAVLNKCDLPRKVDFSKIKDSFESTVEISAKETPDTALLKIQNIVKTVFTDEKISIGEDAVISSARQNSALTAALEMTESAIEALRLGMSQDAVSSDIERALGRIAELDGRAVSEEVVADIFSKFCVGK
jgi:tRNA modification GTPase